MIKDKFYKFVKERENAVSSAISLILILVVFFSVASTAMVVGPALVNDLEARAEKQAVSQDLMKMADDILKSLLEAGSGSLSSGEITIKNKGTAYIEEVGDRAIISWVHDKSFDFDIEDIEQEDGNDKDITIVVNNGDISSFSVYQFEDTCFLAGTKVLMADGSYKNIEDVNIGDLVSSFDIDKNIVTKSIVENVFCYDSFEMGDYYLVFNNDLCVTPNHLFFSDGDWLFADELCIGDSLCSSNKDIINIYSIKKVYEKALSYDLDVESVDNYYVCMNNFNVLVHNDEWQKPYGFQYISQDWWDNPEYGTGWYSYYSDFDVNLAYHPTWDDWTGTLTYYFSNEDNSRQIRCNGFRFKANRVSGIHELARFRFLSAPYIYGGEVIINDWQDGVFYTFNFGEVKHICGVEIAFKINSEASWHTYPMKLYEFNFHWCGPTFETLDPIAVTTTSATAVGKFWDWSGYECQWLFYDYDGYFDTSPRQGNLGESDYGTTFTVINDNLEPAHFYHYFFRIFHKSEYFYNPTSHYQYGSSYNIGPENTVFFITYPEDPYDVCISIGNECLLVDWENSAWESCLNFETVVKCNGQEVYRGTGNQVLIEDLINDQTYTITLQSFVDDNGFFDMTPRESGIVTKTGIPRDYGSSFLPPSTPSIPSGPSPVGIGSVAQYSSSAYHSGGEQVWIRFNVNNSIKDWIGPVDSEEEVSDSFSFWDNAGDWVEIRAQAKTQSGITTLYSEWSNPKIVYITDSDTNGGPYPPNYINGPSILDPEEIGYYTALTSDPNNDRICYRVDWHAELGYYEEPSGSGSFATIPEWIPSEFISDWSDWGPSGFPPTELPSYSYKDEGIYEIRFQALDDGAQVESRWSDPFTIYVGIPNNPPDTPVFIEKPESLQSQEIGTFTVISNDEGNIRYGFNWDDGSEIEWTDFFQPDIDVSVYHTWFYGGEYQVRVIAEDSAGLRSDWTDVDLCIISVYGAPDIPTVDIPCERFYKDISYSFIASAAPDNDDTWYMFDWGDGSTSGWKLPNHPMSFKNNDILHQWSDVGVYMIRARARQFYSDIGEYIYSDWSDPISISFDDNVIIPLDSINSFSYDNTLSSTRIHINDVGFDISGMIGVFLFSDSFPNCSLDGSYTDPANSKVPFGFCFILDLGRVVHSVSGSSKTYNSILESGSVISKSGSNINMEKCIGIFEDDEVEKIGLNIALTRIGSGCNSVSGKGNYILDFETINSFIGEMQGYDVFDLKLSFYGDCSNAWYNYFEQLDCFNRFGDVVIFEDFGIGRQFLFSVVFVEAEFNDFI